ncbi:alpha/beta hydrolase [Acinetobacter sp. TGL-Y2]|uniref:alpha/beta hydrolase n=1 Tax=Acinetobacter sp. TGL-Y2 TaxID=1407071 RepID=UPI000A646553|nr:alpha/beta hydrolase [Acinetobacter sp. TGL-Y2]
MTLAQEKIIDFDKGNLTKNVHEFDRVPVILKFTDPSKIVETYGSYGQIGQVSIEGQFLIPKDIESKILYVMMHPTGSLNRLPMPLALVKAGKHVLCANSRYPSNDSSLIMEKVVKDLSQYIQYAKEVKGYEKIVLVGWSGGGSLSLFYQAQAENTTITHTPAGDVYDLTKENLIPADAVIFIAAHLSRAETLTEWIDPSVIDENNPDVRDIEFDIYSPDCPNKPPFSADFVEAFRQKQRERNRKITEWVLATLKQINKKGESERGFVTHRTMCDVRWIDKTIDPNGRTENECYLGDPVSVNCAPAGLARFSTLRSWLSQWSIDYTNAKGVDSAKLIQKTPVLQIINEADDAVPATHNPTIRDALATSDATYIEIKGATHYYRSQPELMTQCIDHIKEWAEKRNFW